MACRGRDVAEEDQGLTTNNWLTKVLPLAFHYHGSSVRDFISDRKLKLLLIPGSDINKTCHIARGHLLKFAALAGCEICIDLLKKLGASTNLRDWFGNTILHDVAASRNRIQHVLKMGILLTDKA